MFVWPIVLLVMGGHYWWNSRIYLVFPAIMLLVAALATELYPRRTVLPVSAVPSSA